MGLLCVSFQREQKCKLKNLWPKSRCSSSLLLLSVPSSISSEPEDGPRLSLTKKPMPKPDRELREGKADKHVSKKLGFFFLLLETTDCKGWPLSSEGHSYFKEFQFCLRDRQVFSAATAFLGLWIPRNCCALELVFPTCWATQYRALRCGAVGLGLPHHGESKPVCCPGAFQVSVFPVVRAAEGWMLEAACPDALLNVLDHTKLATTSLCRPSLRFHVLAHMKSLVYKPVSRHFI